MEQFVGTVDASAETRAFNDIGSQEPNPSSTADYIRPAAMKSDYLDGSVSPAVLPIGGLPEAA